MSDLARIDVADHDTVACVLTLSGEIDLSNAGVVLDDLSAAVPNDVPRVVLDLGATTYLDSSGIAMLFKLSERLGYSRQELRLVVPVRSPIRAVLELTNVGQLIPIDAELPSS